MCDFEVDNLFNIVLPTIFLIGTIWFIAYKIGKFIDDV